MANVKDDLEREISIQATTQKLKGILTTIEEGIKGSDSFCFQGSWIGDDDVVDSYRREDRRTADSGRDVARL